MNQSRSFSLFLSVCLVLFAAGTAISQQAEASYDLTLQLIIGSSEAGMKDDVPANLSMIGQRLNSRFTFASYRLSDTFQSRVVDGGGTEYKSLMNMFGEAADPLQPSFLEFSITNFQALPQNKNLYQARMFRFGARVPVATGGSFKDDAGKSRQVTVYEHLGLTQNKFGIAENVPTLVGTLNLPGANGTIFLIMTVRTAEM